MSQTVFLCQAIRMPRSRGKPDGRLNEIKPIDLMANPLADLQKRTDLDTPRVEDLIMGCVAPVRENGPVLSKIALRKAGWAGTVPGVRLNRFCVSGLDPRENPLGIPVAIAIDRLYRQATEALRCLVEGVLNSETGGNTGSILAIGYPTHTGGALQYIRGIGNKVFRDRANALSDRYFDRFRVSAALLAALPDQTMAKVA